jgi:integrase
MSERRGMPARPEAPIRRINPSGKVVWVARYTRPDGKRVAAKPSWNRGRGTFNLKGDAQRAIVEAYELAYGLAPTPETVGGYFAGWRSRHRSKRTHDTNRHRVSRLLDVVVEGRELRFWRLDEVRRRQVLILLDHMLLVEGRAQLGAVGILRAFSAMWEDAIDDELAGANPWKGVKVRASDSRIRKPPRRQRVFSFERMHEFARAGGRNEALIRTFSDTGMRLGEVLPLRRADFDGDVFDVRHTAHEGEILEGTKTDHGEVTGGRIVPCPPGLAALIRSLPPRIDTELLFPTPTGLLWRERNFYRDVWEAAQERWAGVDPELERKERRQLVAAADCDVRPHEMRHSYVSHLRAAGVDDADLAEIAGHRVETMLQRYTHPLRQSFDRVRGVVETTAVFDTSGKQLALAPAEEG